MSYWAGLTGWANGLGNGLGYYAIPPDTHGHKN